MFQPVFRLDKSKRTDILDLSMTSLDRSFEIKKSKIEKFSPANYAWSYDQPHAERHQNTGSILSKKQNQKK